MKSKLKGKWAQELHELDTIKKKLERFKLDVASIKSVSPQLFVNYLDYKVAIILQKIKDENRPHYFDFRIKKLELDIEEYQQDIAKLTVLINTAEATAKKITARCEKINRDIAQDYSSKTSVELSKLNIFTGHDNDMSIFDTNRNASGRVWGSLRPKDSDLLSLDSQAFMKYKHNTLAFLLLSDNQTFTLAIKDGLLPIEGEIGYLILQRLQEIQYLKQPGLQEPFPSNMRTIAGKAIRNAMDIKTSENLLKCDFPTLGIEINKLVLHSQLHPDNKIFWLGSARVVNKILHDQPGKGTYLNCDDGKWSWQLNRYWLQAAIYLGYTCKLIEQHFPMIESALLSQDPSAFVLRLLLAMREEGEDNTSQYNGNDGPTATTQEILVLMDLGCKVTKNQEQSILISKSSTHEIHSPSRSRMHSPTDMRRSRSHSWDGSNSASPSAMGVTRGQFFAPESSANIRQNNSFTPIPFDMDDFPKMTV